MMHHVPSNKQRGYVAHQTGPVPHGPDGPSGRPGQQEPLEPTGPLMETGLQGPTGQPGP